MSFGGHTILAGVMGWPIGHSRSPRLHGYWLRHYRIDGAYLPLAVAPEDLPTALRGLRALGFAGVNVTVPHKEAVLAAVESADPLARRIGAVNTITVAADGGLHGTNTDSYGFSQNLGQAAPGWAADRPALVIGAGGAGRAVCVALLDAGVPELRLTNRTGARADALASEMRGPIEPVPWAERADALDGAGLVVNTTTLGMTGAPPLDLDLGSLPADAVVCDIVYTPLATALLRAAAARGNATVDGLGMLLHQARPGFAAWFGRDPEVTPELRDFVLADLA